MADAGMVLEAVAGAVAVSGARWTVLLGVAVAAAWLVRGSASGRHAVWLLALVGLVVLPAAERVVPEWRVPAAMARWVGVVERGIGPVAGTGLGEGEGGAGGARSSVVADLVVAGGGAAGRSGENGVRKRGSAVARVAGAWPAMWAAVALVMTGLWVTGQLAVARLAGRSRPTRNGRVEGVLAECVRGLGIRRQVRLRVVAGAAVPMTWGVVRPVILLPAGSAGWSADRLRAVLLHELAHVARFDVVVHAMSRLACAIFWFHPGAWYAARAVRVEAESACDDRVIRAGVRPVDYAAELLHLARSLRPGAAVPGGALPVTHGSGLERRIRAVLAEGRTRSLPRRTALALTASAVLLVGGVAGLRRADGAARPVERAWALPWELPGAGHGWTLGCDDSPGTACADRSRATLARLARTGHAGAVVAQDVNTGEIVLYAAVADSVSNMAAGVPLAAPASLAKLAIAALWWESGFGDGDQVCPGIFRLSSGHEVRNFAERDLGSVAGPRGMLVASCNTAAAAMTVELHRRLGSATVRNALRAFGFGADNEPGNGPDSAFWAPPAGTLSTWTPPPRPFAAIGPAPALEDLVQAAIGAAPMATTPLHVSRFLQAIGNRGLAVPPRPADGLDAARRTAADRILSDSTAARLREALTAAVREGTGQGIADRIDRSAWDLGGKTGSILLPDGSVDGWFAGLAFDPAGHPAFTIVVFLRGGGYGGGLPAGLAADVLALLASDPPGGA